MPGSSRRRYVTRDDVRSAADRILGHVRDTPSLALGDVLDAGFDLWLKLDSFQPTGSFKVRGAFSAMLAAGHPECGFAAASGGNFGLAVAYAANRLGDRATVFVPETSPEEKIGKISQLGASVVTVPGYYAEALEASEHFVAESGAFSLHAYDQVEVIAGQGTCGMEIMSQVPDPTSVLVAVGGGGLIGGIATWIQDEAKVVAVEPELCPTLNAARRAGSPVDVQVSGVAASSLGAARLGRLPWAANRWVQDSLLLADADIVLAQRWLWDTCRVVAEPSASTTLAALLTGEYQPASGEHVVAVISGANTRLSL
jgi:threonine dehydratase